MTTTRHPDFSRAPLSAEQVTWLRQAGIEARSGECGFGFWFVKGESWIAPIRATDSRVYVVVRDLREDSDGEKVAATFPRLRDALRFLASV